VLAARRLDASRRALPDFVIVGAQKAGTTTLYTQLTSHPSVLPALRKEAHYLDEPPRPLDHYRAFFPRRSAMAAAAQRTGAARTGEATPFYLLHPAAPARLRAAAPDAKVIAILRDPVARAISGYHHAVRMRDEHRPIEIALDPARDELVAPDADVGWFDAADCPARLRGYLARGRYVEQLERWYAAFPGEQVLVLETSELDSGVALATALDFLGLPAVETRRSSDRNVAGYAAPTTAVDERLRAYFAPHNERLFELLGVQWPWPAPA
jgi:Sulfotransferase domain